MFELDFGVRRTGNGRSFVNDEGSDPTAPIFKQWLSKRGNPCSCAGNLQVSITARRCPQLSVSIRRCPWLSEAIVGYQPRKRARDGRQAQPGSGFPERERGWTGGDTRRGVKGRDVVTNTVLLGFFFKKGVTKGVTSRDGGVT
jgi:hypothetical protein